jgi:hypothetical protein
MKLTPGIRVYLTEPDETDGPQHGLDWNLREGYKFMPVIARFCGIVIRLLCLRSFGPRLHAFHGDSEMVVDLTTLRIIDADVPEAVKCIVMAWASDHQREVLAGKWHAV